MTEAETLPFFNAPLMAIAPNWVAGTLDKPPKNEPIGVRTADTIYTVFVMLSIFGYEYRYLILKNGVAQAAEFVQKNSFNSIFVPNFKAMNFELEYSATWLIGILLLSLFASWFSYRKKNGFSELSRLWRASLYTVRFVSVFLIATLLLGVFIKTYIERIEQPLFFVVTDQSASMLNYKDSSTVAENIKKTRDKITAKYGSKFDIKTLSVGANVKDNVSNSFEESSSNLEAVFAYIHSNFYNRNIGGITFISDGNFNVGANPIYNAAKIRTTPIFCLSVGDSIQKKDQLVRSVFNNPLAFLMNDFPVEIDISSFQFPEEESVITISKKGKVIASKTLRYGKNTEDFQKVRFLIPADELGNQIYTIKLEEKKNEISYKNNSKNFYVEVLDSRNKVLLLSSAPHPDISAIKNVLATDDKIEFESALFKDWDGKINQTNILICHSPQKNTDLNIIKRFEEENIPILYILGPSTNEALYGRLSIQFPPRSAGKRDNLQAALNDNFSEFVIDPLLRSSLNFYPPLQGHYGDFKPPNGAKILFNQRIGSVKKDSPLLFFQIQRGKRYAAIMGEGIWRWRINEFQREQNHTVFNKLIDKTIQYLTVPGKSKGLTVRFPNKISKQEELVVNGVFYNSSLEAITSPLLNLSITDENSKKYTTQFSVYEDGYQAQLGKLNPGRYTWEVETEFKNKTERKSGVFIVEDIDQERAESVANHSVLKQLAKQSNGGFYKLSESDGLINDLSERSEIESVSFSEEASFKLIDYTWYLILCILFLFVEWFMKRLKGLR